MKKEMAVGSGRMDEARACNPKNARLTLHHSSRRDSARRVV